MLDNPDGGAYSLPNALQFGNAGGETGSISFTMDVKSVSVWALSGPGNDLLSDPVFIQALNSDDDVVAADTADPTLQFDQLLVSAPDIRKVIFSSPESENDVWDHFSIICEQCVNILTFEHIDELDEYESSGVTFSSTAGIWTSSNMASVKDNPNGGTYSPPSALVFDADSNASGNLFFAMDVKEVSVWALSGPGSDSLNFPVYIQAFDAEESFISADTADTSLQFDLLTVSGTNIRRIDFFSPNLDDDIWDNVTFVVSDEASIIQSNNFIKSSVTYPLPIRAGVVTLSGKSVPSSYNLNAAWKKPSSGIYIGYQNLHQGNHTDLQILLK